MKRLAKIIIASVAALFATQSVAVQQAWDYTGKNGPAQWSATYPACSAQMQSPIDIPSGTPPNKNLPSLEFVFTPTSAKVVDDGHRLEASMLNKSNTLSIGSAAYLLTGFNVHLPSENRVAGKAYPAEIQLVYKDNQGGLAVVGIFVKPGQANTTLAQFIQAARLGDGMGGYLNKIKEKISASKTLAKHQSDQSTLVINANDFLPDDSNAYYSFTGSLTTPPCTGNITWYLLAEPITASVAQLNALEAFYYNNIRPVQPIDGRNIHYKPPETAQSSD